MTDIANINFRPLGTRASDLDLTVHALSECPYAFRRNAVRVATSLLKREGCFAIQTEQKSIGILQLIQHQKRLEIKAIALCPEFRNTPEKYGTKTIGILQACARKITRTLTLEVYHENKEAIKLYKNLGFKCRISGEEMSAYFWQDGPKQPHEPEFDIDLLEQLFDRENQRG